MTNGTPITEIVATQSLTEQLATWNKNMRRNASEVYAVAADETIDSWGSGGASEYAEIINVDETAAAVTVTLPVAADNIGRRIIAMQDTAGGNNTTIDVDGGGTIDGASSVALAGQYQKQRIVSIGTEWRIF